MRYFHPRSDFFIMQIKHLIARRGDWNSLALHHVCNFSRGPILIDFGQFNRGGLKVDLTLRLNVLAVCVAIAFVGAILVMF